MQIEILVGLIGSGKSSYCRRRAQDGALIINDDSIVNALHAFDYTLYDESLKPLYKSVENHILTMAVPLDRDVIIDRPNLTKASRDRYIAIGKSLDVESIKAIKFPFEGKKVHLDRRMKDSRGWAREYWDACFDKHYADWVHYCTDDALVHQFKPGNVLKLMEGWYEHGIGYHCI